MLNILNKAESGKNFCTFDDIKNNSGFAYSKSQLHCRKLTNYFQDGKHLLTNAEAADTYALGPFQVQVIVS